MQAGVALDHEDIRAVINVNSSDTSAASSGAGGTAAPQVTAQVTSQLKCGGEGVIRSKP